MPTLNVTYQEYERHFSGLWGHFQECHIFATYSCQVRDPRLFETLFIFTFATSTCFLVETCRQQSSRLRCEIEKSILQASQKT